MKTICPHCSQHIEADNEYAGSNVSCPTCNEEFALPTEISDSKLTAKAKIFSKTAVLFNPKIRRWRFSLFCLIGVFLVAIMLQLCGLNIFWKHYPPSYKYLLLIQNLSQQALTVPWPDTSSLWDSHQYKELSAEWNRLANAHSSFANVIRNVPANGVDSELANNILKTADFYDSLSQWDASAAQAALEADSYNEKYNSGNAMVLGFLKGAAGYSVANAINEEQSDNEMVNDQQRNLENTKLSLNEIHAELESDRARIKMRLSNQDGLAYPHENY